MRQFLFIILLLVLAGVCWAGTNTTKLELYKPAEKEGNWTNLVNANYDTLDNATLHSNITILNRIPCWKTNTTLGYCNSTISATNMNCTQCN